MNLSEFREYFKEFSGRYNLGVVELNGLINAGGKFLSAQLAGHYGESLFPQGLKAGYNFLDVTKYLTSVSSIFMLGYEGLEARTHQELSGYGSYAEFLRDWPGLETGIPTAYAMVPPLVIANSGDMHTAMRPVEKWSSVLFKDANPVLVVFNKQPEVRVDYRILGRAQIRPLTLDTDSNYLTHQHPVLLAHAVLYHLELKMRQYGEAGQIMQTVSALLQAEAIKSIGVKASQMPDEVE